MLLLEAGGPDANPDIHNPTRAWQVWATADDWWYPTTPQGGQSNRSLFIPRGKVLGGSSSINGAIYVRGFRGDYDHWAYLGNAGWDYESVLPYFKKSEDYYAGANAYHGAGGPLSVSRVVEPTPMTEAFIESGVAMGMARNADFAGPSTMGIGLCDLTMRDGRRHSTAVAFLRPAMNRPNLTVATHALARRLIFNGTRCTGVEYAQDGKITQELAAREVIVCAGAIASPKLLMLSGIGAADELKAHGITPIADLPGVGKNLQDHLLTFVIHEGKKTLPESKYNILEAHFFAKSDSRLPGPDHQPLFMTVAPPLPYLDIPPNSYALAPGIIRPASRGEISLTSGDSDAPLSIDPGYLREESDHRKLVHSLEVSIELMEGKPFAAWNKRRVWPQKTDRKSLETYVREASETYHHHVGTCKMGLDGMSVVDAELRVYGVDGLRVADASIMPDVVSGNTNAPSIMIGEKAADMIRAAV